MMIYNYRRKNNDTLMGEKEKIKCSFSYPAQVLFV